MKTLIVVLMSLGGFAKAETTLSVLFSDRMVLQQKQENAVWGWDDVGVDVTVEVAGQSYVGKAGADGRWEVRLGAMVASAEPKEMRVKGTSEIFVKDILVGEVWL